MSKNGDVTLQSGHDEFLGGDGGNICISRGVVPLGAPATLPDVARFVFLRADGTPLAIVANGDRGHAELTRFFALLGCYPEPGYDATFQPGRGGNSNRGPRRKDGAIYLDGAELKSVDDLYRWIDGWPS